MNLRKVQRYFFLLFGLTHLLFGPSAIAVNDTSAIRYYIDKCDELIFTQPDLAIKYVDTISDLSHEINYRFGIYKSHNSRAIHLFLKGDYEESIAEYQKAIPFADTSKPFQTIRVYGNIALSLRSLNLADSAIYYTKLVSSLSKEKGLTKPYHQSLLDLASIYRNKEDYIKSAEYFELVVHFTDISTDTVFLLKAYSNLAMFFQSVENFEKARSFYYKAIKIDKNYENINLLASNYGNIGLLYQKLVEDYDSALYFYRLSIRATMPYEHKYKTLIANVNIGNVHLERGDYDSAYYYYRQEMKNPLLEKDPLISAAIFTNMGMYYYHIKDYKLSLEFLNRGLNFSKENQLLSYQKSAYLTLSDVHNALGEPELSLLFYKTHHLISDSLKTLEAQKHLSIIEYDRYLAQEKYHNRLLVHENENQQKQITYQKLIIITILLGLIFLIILAIMALRNKRIERELHEQQKKTNEHLEVANHKLQSQQQEMKELLSTKDRFVSVLGHDLKNPFAGLLGLLDLMLEDWEEISDIEKRSRIKQLAKSSHQTYEFLQSLLDWGKTQQGMVQVHFENIYLKDVINEMLDLYKIQYAQKNIIIHEEIPADISLVSDSHLLGQILQNLFYNAIKFSHEGGEISIRAFEKSGKSYICIADKGIGIPAGKIKDLFNLDGSFNRRGTMDEESSGMGLLLCKEYAVLLKGDIEVKSVQNKGSEFCVII